MPLHKGTGLVVLFIRGRIVHLMLPPSSVARPLVYRLISHVNIAMVLSLEETCGQSLPRHRFER